MAAPSTVPELLDRLRRSGLVPADRLEGFLVGLHASGSDPKTVVDLLDRLVEVGMITRFHAERLAAGKYKGFQLGSYLILDQLGTGGMGQVYLAEHTAMRRLVGLKVLPLWADDAVARERFLREARAAATLDHPNIVRVFDLCQEGKLLYLVMEYVDGVSLQALVAKYGPLDVNTACHYARQVAFGLQNAYELGFVHRDIKPANLLLDRAGVVKILDLGLVRSEADADAGLTKQLDNKSILGTADYVAPEQAVDSSNVDIRADIYSLGATLYYLLAGRPLFPEGRTAQKLVWQQIKDPVPISRLRPEVSEDLAEVVHTMLQKRPSDRYQTPNEVFEALAPWTQDDVPPPDDSVMPKVTARVLVARQAATGNSTPRISGSTSQILALAMKRPGSGSGPVGAGGTRKPDSQVLTPAHGRPGLHDPSVATEAMSAVNTTRTPGDPKTRSLPDYAWTADRKLLTLIGGLALALIIAVTGLVILALR
jgi:serine/threonine-protein kinase